MIVRLWDYTTNDYIHYYKGFAGGRAIAYTDDPANDPVKGYTAVQAIQVWIDDGFSLTAIDEGHDVGLEIEL